LRRARSSAFKIVDALANLVQERCRKRCIFASQASLAHQRHKTVRGAVPEKKVESVAAVIAGETSQLLPALQDLASAP
jgi:hypothetical protein